MSSVSTRKTSLIFGLFFAATFIFSIPASLLYKFALQEHDFLLSAGSRLHISIGALLEIFLAICNIATAIVIFPLVRRVSEPMALGYVAVRIVESLIILTGVISLLSVMTLRGTMATNSDIEVLTIAARSMVAFHDGASLLGPQFCSGFGNGILLGYLMYRSQLVPGRMALLGLVGGPLALTGGVLVLFGVVNMESPELLALTALEIIWELSITIYALARGFRTTKLTMTGEQ